MHKRAVLFAAVSAVLLGGTGLFTLSYFGLLPEKSYTAADFGITPVVSPLDFNQNGKDDYTDLLEGAKEEARRHPAYDSAYVPGGYPSPETGVCTDLVWRAFRQAGYSLKDMVDRDVQQRPDAYTHIQQPDPHIDFRRVRTLRVYFDTYAQQVTTDLNDIGQWQPGDIVIFGEDKHIGILSDKRNRRGMPYVLHNNGQKQREQDYLPRSRVTGHYRFDASRLSPEQRLVWEEPAPAAGGSPTAAR